MLDSGKEGPNILIIGGTHGDETAGFNAAEVMLSYSPPVGKVLVIPRANKKATYLDSRKSENDIDLNRSYPGNKDGNAMEQLTYEIMEMIKEFKPEVIIDMHESLNFNNIGKRLGNSIIFEPIKDTSFEALEILDYINKVNTDNVNFTFFNNPPKGSLNATVSEMLEIPVYTIETCRKNELDTRIYQQIHITKKILELYGMEIDKRDWIIK